MSRSLAAMAYLGLSLVASGCATNTAVRVVDRLETGFSEKEGAVLAPKRVRAWIEDIERDTSAATLVVRGGGKQTLHSLDVSPDSSTIIFSLIEEVQKSQDSGGQGAAPSKYSATLRSVSSQGGGISQLTTGRWLDLRPAYGPPGFVTFDSNRTRPDGRDLFRISADRAGGVSVIRQSNDGFSHSPSVSTDGTTAFEFKPDYRQRGLSLASTAPQLWTVGGSNNYPTQLREGSSPAVSPDGKKIVYIGENGQLWVMGIGGTAPIQLTSLPLPKDRLDGGTMPKRDPTWSPDGRSIVFASADGKDSEQYPNYDVWMIASNGGQEQQLTTNGSADLFPRVSDDGSWIYFISNRGFSDGIWRIPFPAQPTRGFVIDPASSVQ